MAPGDGIAHRALPGWQVASPAGQQGQSRLEPSKKRAWRQHFHPGRRQLDGQRQAVQPLADPSNGRRVLLAQLEARLHSRRALRKQRHRRIGGHLVDSSESAGVGYGERSQGNSCSPRTWNGSRLVATMVRPGLAPRSVVISGAAARSRSQLSRTSSSRFGARNADSVSMRGRPAGLPDAECRSNRGHDQVGIDQRRQIDEDDPVGKRGVHLAGDRDGQARLADATGSSQRQPPDLVILQSVLQCPDFRLTPNEPGQRAGERDPSARCLGRRSLLPHRRSCRGQQRRPLVRR